MKCHSAAESVWALKLEWRSNARSNTYLGRLCNLLSVSIWKTERLPQCQLPFLGVNVYEMLMTMGVVYAGRGAGRIPLLPVCGLWGLGTWRPCPPVLVAQRLLPSVPFSAWMAQESPISGLRLLRRGMWWHDIINTENNTHRNVWLLWIYLIFLTTLPICFLCLWFCFLMHAHLKLLCLTAGLTLLLLCSVFFIL